MEALHPLDRLFERAKTNGVPMSRVCELANVDATTPSRWRRGKTRPSADKLFALEVALDKILQGQSA